MPTVAGGVVVRIGTVAPASRRLTFAEPMTRGAVQVPLRRRPVVGLGRLERTRRILGDATEAPLVVGMRAVVREVNRLCGRRRVVERAVPRIDRSAPGIDWCRSRVLDPVVQWLGAAFLLVCRAYRRTRRRPHVRFATKNEL